MALILTGDVKLDYNVSGQVIQWVEDVIHWSWAKDFGHI